MTMNRYIYRKESEPMPTESVKITEKNILSPAETDSPLRRELDEFLFHEGTAHRAHTYLGAHAETDGQGEERVVFRVWAPNAAAVFVVGDFCGWDEGLAMQRVTEAGVWQAASPDARDGMLYKFRILTKDGRVLYKADPYARACELPPATAARIYTSHYAWRDKGWLKHRAKTMANDGFRRCPINIYELHLGSWLRHEDGR
jgi:1,4-alpha-glucan branching enzyme